jgi:alpha-beta hydrolase superfamily lysophospholipase
VNPFFFGTSDQQLLGVHHPPEQQEVRDGAVLLCPPLGHEYVAAHGSLQQLASRLARAGFHALRFDYFGTGDSAGEIGAASVEHWIRDVQTAVEELRDTSGSKQVCVVGLRLGATIAALAAARARAAGNHVIRAAVLWEPILRGQDHLDEIYQLQERWLAAMYLRSPRHLMDSARPEVMGFEWPTALQAELRAIDLADLTAAPADHVLIMQNTPGDRYQPLQQKLASFGCQAQAEHLPATIAWTGAHWQTIALPPAEVIRRISSWIVDAHK